MKFHPNGNFSFYAEIACAPLPSQAGGVDMAGIASKKQQQRPTAKKGGLFDLERQFDAYAPYHQNKVYTHHDTRLLVGTASESCP